MVVNVDGRVRRPGEPGPAAQEGAAGIRLKRNTIWDKVNATPEPVRKGSKITVKARLRVADWTNDEYDG
jgi:hypothetical protein